MAVRIHEQLQQQIEEKLKVSGLPVVKSTEATQRGKTFGRRLANAVSDCWAQGFDKLIIVGGDAPELSSTDIIRAQLALEAGRPTLGKNFRGGSFLIGLLKKGFRQNQFAELPWQTNALACALKEALGLSASGNNADVLLLSGRADCNTQHDLSGLAKRLASDALATILNNPKGRVRAFETYIRLVSGFGESQTLRGPPAELRCAA